MSKPLSAILSRWLPPVLVLLLPLAFFSCLNESEKDIVVLSFNLDSTQLGGTDSLRFEIYNGKAPAPGDSAKPVQVVSMKTPKGSAGAGKVEIKLSDKVGEDFSVIVIGFDSSGVAHRKLYDFENQAVDPEKPSVVLLSAITSGDLRLVVGETKAPSLVLKPSEAADKRVVLSSGDTTVVKVTGDGKDSLKAVGSGEATITLTAMVGGAQGRMVVTVTSVPAIVHVDSVKAKPVSGLVGDTLEIEVVLVPENATDKTYALKSLDTSIAAVAGLKVVGKSQGKTKVVATAVDGGVADTVDVTISRVAIRVDSVTASNLRGLVGDSLAPALTWLPADATNQNFTLRSLDSTVVTVSGRKVVAVKLGSARVSVEAEDGGARDTFTVAVVKPAFRPDILPITTSKCAPCHIPGQVFNFQDSAVLVRTGVAALDRLQRSPDAPGKMPLKGSEKGDLSPRQLAVLLEWLKANVVPVTGMTAENMTANLGDTVAPALIWTPADASNQTYSLTSIDSAIVAVTPDGRLATKALGTATVLAQSVEGGFKPQFKVTVRAPSFAKNVLPITTLKCAPCHVPGQTFNFQDSSLLVLEGADALDRLKRDSLAAGKMPLRGAPNGDLTPFEKTILLAWLNAKVVPLRGISVADDSVLVDEEKAPKVTYVPANANNRSYVLESLDTAKVGINGDKFLGRAVGTALIKIRALDGNHLDTLTVKVKPVPVDSIAAFDTSAAVGEIVEPRVEIFPENAAVKTYALSLLRPSTVLAIGADGIMVLALAVGKDTVVATSTDGAKKARLVFTVGPVVPKSISVRDTNGVLAQLVTPTVLWNPVNTTNKVFTLSIRPADTGIAAVRGTQVLGKALGKVTVTVTSAADTTLKDSYSFTVGPVPLVSLSATPTTRYPGVTLNARTLLSFVPANATDRNFKLTSSNALRVKVLSDSTFQTLKMGLTPLTVTAADSANGRKTATLNVTVIRAPFRPQGAVDIRLYPSIYNITSTKCIECHGPLVWPARNWTDSASFVAFKKQALTRIKSTGLDKMPPAGASAGPLDPAQLSILENWLMQDSIPPP